MTADCSIFLLRPSQVEAVALLDTFHTSGTEAGRRANHLSPLQNEIAEGEAKNVWAVWIKNGYNI